MIEGVYKKKEKQVREVLSITFGYVKVEYHRKMLYWEGDV